MKLLLFFQVQNYTIENGGQALDIEEWKKMFNLSQDIGNDLLKSSVVKQLLGYGFFFNILSFWDNITVGKIKSHRMCVSENSETCRIFISYTCMLETTTYYGLNHVKVNCVKKLRN